MQEQVTRLRGSWGSLPGRAQLSVFGVALVTLVVLFFVVRAATHTTWVPATDKLSQNKIGEAQGVLEKANIETRVGDFGTLEVPKSKMNEAAAKLAEANIAFVGHTSCEAMGKESGAFLGSTKAQQTQRDRSCLQNEVANMIERVGSVDSAEVALTLPGEVTFREDETPAKASVTVDTGGSSLTQENVRAINALVTNSVKGLQPENVAIVDQTGHMYASEDATGSLSENMLKHKMQTLVDNQTETRLTQKFEEIAGTGKVKVLSNVELDMDRIRREVKDVGGENNDRGPIASEQHDFEQLNNEDGATGGTVGTTTNTTGDETPEGDVSADDNGGTGTTDETGADEDNRVLSVDRDAAATDARYLKDSGGTDYANDEVREAIEVAPGNVRRYRLSVVVDTSVDPATANEVKNAAETWLGGNAEDSFSFGQAPIAKLDESRAATKRFESLGAYIKWAVLGMALILMAFFLRRTLNQRQEELLYPMDDLLALEPGFDPVPLRELEAAVAASTPIDTGRLDLERKVGSIAQEKPQEVAQMLRGWLHEVDPYKRSA